MITKNKKESIVKSINDRVIYSLIILNILFASLSTLFGFLDNPFYTKFRLSTPSLIVEMIFGSFLLVGLALQFFMLLKTNKNSILWMVAISLMVPIIFLNIIGFIALPVFVVALMAHKNINNKKVWFPVAASLTVLALPAATFITLLSWAAATTLDSEDATSYTIKDVNNNNLNISKNKEMSIISWNLGYASTGSEMDYFYDVNYNGVHGSRGRAWSKTQVADHMKGITEFIKVATNGGSVKSVTTAAETKDFNGVNSNMLKDVQIPKVDFMFLQEVDKPSVRSMYFDEPKMIADSVKNYDIQYVNNFKVGVVPAPFLDQNGQVDAGVLTLSKYNIDHSKARRYSLNSAGKGIVGMMNLKRAIGYTEYKVGSKLLHLANVHMSAFPEDKEKRDKEYRTIIDLIKKWQKNGDYVIFGGDWNTDITDQYYYEKNLNTKKPNSFKNSKDIMNKSNVASFLGISNRKMTKGKNLNNLGVYDISKFTEYFRKNISKKGYKLGVDMNVKHPTMRMSGEVWNGYQAKLKNHGSDFGIIDGFLVSSNVKIKTTTTIQQGWHKNNLNKKHPYSFADTDHNPVLMKFELN